MHRKMRLCSMNVRAKCYSTLVRPGSQTHARVQIPCIRPYLQSDMDCLEKVQRCCARFAFQEFSSESSVSSLMHTQQWEPLAERRVKTNVTTYTTNTRGHLLPIRHVIWPNKHLKACLLPRRNQTGINYQPSSDII